MEEEKKYFVITFLRPIHTTPTEYRWHFSDKPRQTRCSVSENELQQTLIMLTQIKPKNNCMLLSVGVVWSGLYRYTWKYMQMWDDMHVNPVENDLNGSAIYNGTRKMYLSKITVMFTPKLNVAQIWLSTITICFFSLKFAYTYFVLYIWTCGCTWSSALL